MSGKWGPIGGGDSDVSDTCPSNVGGEVVAVDNVWNWRAIGLKTMDDLINACGP